MLTSKLVLVLGAVVCLADAARAQAVPLSVASQERSIWSSRLDRSNSALPESDSGALRLRPRAAAADGPNVGRHVVRNTVIGSVLGLVGGAVAGGLIGNARDRLRRERLVDRR